MQINAHLLTCRDIMRKNIMDTIDENFVTDDTMVSSICLHVLQDLTFVLSILKSGINKDAAYKEVEKKLNNLSPQALLATNAFGDLREGVFNMMELYTLITLAKELDA